MNQRILQKLAQFVQRTTLRQLENLTLSILKKKLDISEDDADELMTLLQEERIVMKKYTFQCPKCHEMNTVLENELNYTETCQSCGEEIPVKDLAKGATVAYILDKNDFQEYLEEQNINVLKEGAREKQETSIVISFEEAIDTRKLSLEKENMGLQQDKKVQLFISHAKADIKYITCFVKFLEDLGMDEGNIFCSSIDGYGIQWGKNIFDYLKDQFTNAENELMVLFMLSDNYYDSAACLNEMGAAWVLKKDYRSILLPGFEFKDIDGAIDPRQLAIKLDDENIMTKLNDIKQQFTLLFDLKKITDTKWDRVRKEFIDGIKSIIDEESKAGEETD